MQSLYVTTFQNVKLNLNTQVTGLRILAFLIDFVILGLSWISLSYFYIAIIQGNRDWENMEDYSIDIFLIIIQLPLYFYSFLTEFFFNGQTFGKMACGLKVIKVNGYHCGFIEYFMRWLFRMIDIYPFIILSALFEEFGTLGFMLIGLPAIITTAFSEKGQRLGDIIAGTTVVKLQNKSDLSVTILKELQAEYSPVFPNVIRLSDNDMRIIKTAYETSLKTRDHDVMRKIRAKIEEVTNIKSNMSNVEFLDTIMKDYNYYTQNMT